MQATLLTAAPVEAPVVASATTARLKKVPAPITQGEIHRTRLREFLVAQSGKFVRLDFVKLDGSSRTLVGRLKVRSHLKGGKNNVEALDRPYLTMFDTQAQGYRAVNLNTVVAVHANRQQLTVID